MVLRNAAGVDSVVGNYTGALQLDFPFEKALVPHLQRLSPSGKLLATYDRDRQKIRLWRVGSQDVPRELAVRGIGPVIRQFRWLADGAGFVVMTQREVHILRLSAGRLKHASAVLGTRERSRVTDVWDTRVTADGVLIRYDVRAPGAETDRDSVSKVAVARVSRGTIRRLVPIPTTEAADSIAGATVLAGGRIAVVEVHWDSGRGWLRTLKRRGRSYVETAREDCASPQCYQITNWSPGSRRVLYGVAGAGIFVERRGEMVKLETGDGPWDTADGLWLNDVEDRVIASSGGRVVAWDGAGKRRWSVTLHNALYVQSLKFDRDGRRVWASVGNRVVRIDDDGKVEDVLHRADLTATSPAAKALHGTAIVDVPTAAVFIDDIIPLPDGGLAYAVVRTKRRAATGDDLHRLGIIGEPTR